MPELNENSIFIEKVSQAGDIFLFSFKCPSCKENLFQGIVNSECNFCQIKFEGMDLKFKPNYNRNLLCGTKRKRLQIRKKLISWLYQIQEGLCLYCFKSLNHEYHVDHIVPVIAGGTNNTSNLALCCPSCNHIAGSKVFSTIDSKRSYILSKNKKKD